ncbi:hypothetical protein FS837_009528 [Tulasnella sp. UAMH 9824]|nr:hypothetical protein FS837_009528 [Tulasnella sp. UAMH 9824]
MTSQSTEKLTKLPAVPKQFGDDGGKFYKYYDELADELDEDMVTSLKSQLDGVLIFAGLFAGVNSAFLAFTLPQMSADPADDTNALLFLIMRGANGTITSPADLPSASFSPPSGALPINILFSMSLTLALLTSFLAVLGQQWLVYYRKRGGGGAEYQRWEQLRRYLGAKHWRLELVLDDVLPSVLQIALVIFCVAFVLYLGTLNKSLCYAVVTPLCVAGALILAMAIFAGWDHWCPFKSPLSHLFQPALQRAIPILGKTMALPVSFIYITFKWIGHRFSSGDVPFAVQLYETDASRLNHATGLKNVAWHNFQIIGDWLKAHSKRSAEPEDRLKLIALKRVSYTSEDSNALAHAATNALTIHDKRLIKQMILEDREFCGRLQDIIPLSRSFSGMLWTIQEWVTTILWFHLVLSAGLAEDLLDPDVQESPEMNVPDGDYATRFIARLSSQLLVRPLYDQLTGAPPTEYPDCPRYAVWIRCVGALLATISDFHTLFFESNYDGLGEPRVNAEDPNSVGYAWVEAWMIQLSKDRYNRDVGEGIHEARAWQIDKLRLFFQTYQELDDIKFVEIICDAIATSAFQWDKRPGHRVYVALFRRVMDFMWACDTECFSSPLKALMILLRAIENRIRDSSTSAEERDSERRYRRTCTEKLITYIRDIHCSTGKGNGAMDPEDTILYRGPLWFHCLKASPPLQEYLQWMKDVIQSDPSSPENPPLMRFLRNLIDCLTFPDEAELYYYKKNSLGLGGMKEWDDLGQVQSYRQFYSAFVEAMTDIESVVHAVRSTAKVKQCFKFGVYSFAKPVYYI